MPALLDIEITGVLADPGNGFGGIPVTLTANFPTAVEMRTASTPAELALAEWRAYDEVSTHWIRTGNTVVGERIVYAEFRDGEGNVTLVEKVVQPFDPNAGLDYQLPPTSALQPDGSPLIWNQEFADGFDRWVSYDYNSGDASNSNNFDSNGTNVFYSASWNSVGGVDNGAYIWTDASRWLIDTPENPLSVLALLTYPQWFGYDRHIDLDGTQVQFSLRGDGLDLKGGSVTFWLVDDHGRWHQSSQPLVVGDGAWTLNTVDIGQDTTGWHNSWQQSPGSPLDLSTIISWGVAFSGFPEGVEPTGVLAMDNFTIAARAMSITGTSDNDVLSDGRGNDTMIGAAGDDKYYLGTGDTVTELENEGFDIVYSRSAHDLEDNVEALYLTGAGAMNGVGNDLANWIYGNDATNTLRGGGGADLLDGGAGADFLYGDAGNDWMRGGADDDTYFVDSTGDTITEYVGEGLDIVYASVFHQLANNVEAVYLTGAGNQDATGNEIGNWIYGTGASNTLRGLGGNDLLDGGGSDDFLHGGAGHDVIRGGDGADLIYGDAGNDGMIGGSGDDTYFVDSTGDTVTELAGGGFDVVYSTATHQLASNAEAVYLTGAGPLNATGNIDPNWIYGNSDANTLRGGGGADLLDGGAGADFLYGDAGSDWMRGGSGDDKYYVDSAGDTITETSGAGFDIVYSTATHQLGANVEAVYLTGAGQLDATGNNDPNWIYGNSEANTLRGGGGADLLDGGDGSDTLYGDTGNDWMRGGSGDDKYHVDSSADVISEANGAGFDIVYSTATHQLGANVEAVYLTGVEAIDATGNDSTNWIYGNGASNTLRGGGGGDLLDAGDGNDRLIGEAGNDVLRGRAGDDVFSFSGEFGRDSIADFQAGAASNDVIELSLAQFASFDAVKAAWADIGGNTVITLADNSITILGTETVDFIANDFLFV